MATALLHTRRARLLVLGCFAVVLAATVASYVARRNAARPEPLRPAAVADDVGQQTQRFSLSKTLADQTVYTIQAEQVTNYEETGKALLSGVTVLIYGKDGSRRDSISTDECVYDPAAGSLWVPGEVEMQFDLPLDSAASPSGDEAESAALRAPVSLVTSQLSFEQSTGIASTSAPVRFTFARGEGRALGAAYDPKAQSVVLQSQVELTFRDASGSAGTPQTHVQAGRVNFARSEGELQRLLLEGAVVISQGGRRIQGGRGEILLDESYSAREAVLEQDVVATENSGELAGEVRGARADFRFRERGRLQGLNMTGDMLRPVTWTTRAHAAGQVREGEARHIQMTFADSTGALERMVAEGAVRSVFRRAGGGASRSAETQTIAGERAELMLRSGGKVLERVQIETGASLLIEPPAGGVGRRTVTADKFDIAFDSRGDISTFRAAGSVEMQGEDAKSQARHSRSDFLEASFQQQTGQPQTSALERVRQWGRFEYRDAERQASAAEAEYHLPAGRIVLEGKPAVWNAEGRLTAVTIALDIAGNGLTAEGGVSSTFISKPKPSSAPAAPLHVTADRLDYDAAAKTSRFQGRARLWQGESFLVEAASLEWRPEQGALLAREKVYSVFRQSPADAKASSTGENATPAGRRDQPVVVRADLLRFERQRWLAHYEGAVEMQSGGGKLTAAQLDVFLQPAGAQETGADLSLSAGRIQRAVAEGGVAIAERARRATGDRADFIPARQEVHLFGAPAAVFDPAKGRVEGSELTYFLGDDSIRVEGKPGLPTDTRWRVP